MPGPIQSGISNALTTATVIAGGAKQLTQEKKQHEESMIQAAAQHEQLLAEQKHQSATLAAAQETAQGVVDISKSAQSISENMSKAQLEKEEAARIAKETKAAEVAAKAKEAEELEASRRMEMANQVSADIAKANAQGRNRHDYEMAKTKEMGRPYEQNYQSYLQDCRDNGVAPQDRTSFEYEQMRYAWLLDAYKSKNGGYSVGSFQMEKLNALRQDPFFQLRQKYSEGKIGSYADYQKAVAEEQAKLNSAKLTNKLNSAKLTNSKQGGNR